MECIAAALAWRDTLYEQQVLGIHQIAQIAQNEARMLDEFNLSHKLYEQGVLDMDEIGYYLFFDS